MFNKYVRYEHHGRMMWVRRRLKGKHRSHCLCWDCKFFTPNNRQTNCPIANRLYEFDVRFAVVTPVWECAGFSVAREGFFPSPELATIKTGLVGC